MSDGNLFHIIELLWGSIPYVNSKNIHMIGAAHISGIDMIQ